MLVKANSKLEVIINISGTIVEIQGVIIQNLATIMKNLLILDIIQFKPFVVNSTESITVLNMLASVTFHSSSNRH